MKKKALVWKKLSFEDKLSLTMSELVELQARTFLNELKNGESINGIYTCENAKDFFIKLLLRKPEYTEIVRKLVEKDFPELIETFEKLILLT